MGEIIIANQIIEDEPRRGENIRYIILSPLRGLFVLIAICYNNFNPSGFFFYPKGNG